MLELDVRLTKDGRCVVFHDQTLLRVTGRDLKIADVEYTALPRLNSKIAIDFIPGKLSYT